MFLGDGAMSRELEAYVYPAKTVRFSLSENVNAALKRYSDNKIVLSVGNVGLRREILESLECGGSSLSSFVHPTSVINRGCFMDKGCVVYPLSVISNNTRLGRAVLVNSGVHIGHDCSIGDNCVIGPNSTICGSVRIGLDVSIGAGSVLLPNIEIADGISICAGSTVLKSIVEQGNYGGNPCIKLRDK